MMERTNAQATMVNITTITINHHDQHHPMISKNLQGTKPFHQTSDSPPLRPLLQFQVAKHPKEPITLTMAMMILGFAEIVSSWHPCRVLVKSLTANLPTQQMFLLYL